MKKTAGILMPVSSLPSPYGIGTLGKSAYRFVNFLRDAGCSLWQVLPLQPTSFGDSPYQTCSAGALNPYFIDLDFLIRDGLLTREEVTSVDWGEGRVDYGKLYRFRIPLLKRAFARFDKSLPAWQEFRREGTYRDYALFSALKDAHGGAPFEEWGDYADGNAEAVSAFAREHDEEVAFREFTQFLFLRQWRQLKAYANAHGVRIVGDMPFYVSRDSVEMWKYRRGLFVLDEAGRPAAQAGVPPDAFSSTGQLWGNPVYDFEAMKEDGYAWWKGRIRSALALYDIVRIDHFIGFVRYYSVPEGEKDARSGSWNRGPGKELFEGVGDAPIVAEDLGLITEEVRRGIDKIGFPGMKILQHAFDGNPYNEHKPSNYTERFFAYTGTHDNLTLYSRLSGMQGEERERMLSDLRSECGKVGVPFRGGSDRDLCRTALRLLYASPASAVLFPLQDALCLGEEGRINRPSEVSPLNWSFRFRQSDFSSSLKVRLRTLAAESGRLGDESFNEKDKKIYQKGIL